MYDAISSAKNTLVHLVFRWNLGGRAWKRLELEKSLYHLQPVCDALCILSRCHKIRDEICDTGDKLTVFKANMQHGNKHEKTLESRFI